MSQYHAAIQKMKQVIMDLVRQNLSALNAPDAIHALYEIETEIANMRAKLQEEPRRL